MKQPERQRGLWSFLTWSFALAQIFVAQQFFGTTANAANAIIEDGGHQPTNDTGSTGSGANPDDSVAIANGEPTSPPDTALADEQPTASQFAGVQPNAGEESIAVSKDEAGSPATHIAISGGHASGNGGAAENEAPDNGPNPIEPPIDVGVPLPPPIDPVIDVSVGDGDIGVDIGVNLDPILNGDLGIDLSLEDGIAVNLDTGVLGVLDLGVSLDLDLPGTLSAVTGDIGELLDPVVGDGTIGATLDDLVGGVTTLPGNLVSDLGLEDGLGEIGPVSVVSDTLDTVLGDGQTVTQLTTAIAAPLDALGDAIGTDGDLSLLDTLPDAVNPGDLYVNSGVFTDLGIAVGSDAGSDPQVDVAVGGETNHDGVGDAQAAADDSQGDDGSDPAILQEIANLTHTANLDDLGLNRLDTELI